jgi:PIN domain nuclease of toxin-antitoxin system
MEGSAELKPDTLAILDEAAADGSLHLSVISVWEIAMLVSRGRLGLSKPLRAWIADSLVDPGPALEPISVEAAMESCRLPNSFRSDPADEIIVATARVRGATLLTRDRRILDYAAAGHVNALRA